jgi:hypothetical protein|tara:strand:+ start:717 stop:1673 length:957 start_codon:yes stop_codon:yes gene_type:complete
MDPKHISRTSFCSKEIDNVTDNSMKKYILDNLDIKTGIKFTYRYAKIYNEQYKKNLNNPHLICLKSSGTPYLLFCTQINDINYCFLIDKKVKDGYEYPKIFIVHYRFSPELFQGTLFETELIRDKNQEWSLLLGDIYHNSGSSLKNVQIHDRMNQCIDIMENKYITDSFCDICPISIKKYFDLNEIRYIFSELIPQLSYRIRGFYFVPLKTSYSKILYIFKDEDYKKVNTSNKKYVSFRLIQTVKPDVYELYLFNEQKTNIMKHSYASIPDTQTSKWVKELCEKKDECIVECKFNTLFQKWVPIKEGSVVDTLLDVKE